MMIALVIGVYLLLIILVVDFFKVTTRKFINCIHLKAIDFKRSPIGQPKLFDELKKCIEEDDEFQRAILNNDPANAIEEFYDSIQTKVNCLDMMDIPIEIVCRDQDKHYKKLRGRNIKFKVDDWE